MASISKEPSKPHLGPLIINIITAHRELIIEASPEEKSRVTISMDELTQRTGADEKEIRKVIRGLYKRGLIPSYREEGTTTQESGRSKGNDRFRILEISSDAFD